MNIQATEEIVVDPEMILVHDIVQHTDPTEELKGVDGQVMRVYGETCEVKWFITEFTAIHGIVATNLLTRTCGF